MRQNILRSGEVSSIYLVYNDGVKRRYNVKLRFSDDKECYLAVPLYQDYIKPKRRYPATLMAYTIDGVYSAEVKISDSNITQNEILYIVNLPKEWKYSQLRRSTRKEVNLPFQIKFNDGHEINTETVDISLGGIAFYMDETIPYLYQKFNGILTLKLPPDAYMDFQNGFLKTEVKFLRERKMQDDYSGRVCYVYKFVSLNSDDANVLKSYLIHIN